MAMTIKPWACLACTEFRGDLCNLNSAPYRHTDSSQMNVVCQGTDHLLGKKHKRAMKRIGHDLFKAETMAKFFKKLGRPPPDFNIIEPVQAFKDYIEECGGHPEKTIVHFAPPPPPAHVDRPQVRHIARYIISKTWATCQTRCCHNTCCDFPQTS